MNAQELLAIVEADAIKHNITTIFLKQKNVLLGNIECSGYFDDEKRLIAVAMDHPEDFWFSILIHEYMHMKQWIENSPLWIDMDGADDDMDEWLGGKDFSPEELARMINSVQAIEADCERRSLDFIKEHNITQIDPIEYAKKANSYVYFYCLIAERRKFYDSDKKPYMIEEVWSQMPDHFDNDYTILPDNYRELFNKYC